METIATVSELAFIITWIIFRFKIERKEKDSWIYGMLSALSVFSVLIVEYIDVETVGIMVPFINTAVIFTPMLLQVKNKKKQ